MDVSISNDDQMDIINARFDKQARASAELSVRVTNVEDRLTPLEDIALSLKEIVTLWHDMTRQVVRAKRVATGTRRVAELGLRVVSAVMALVGFTTLVGRVTGWW